MSHKDIDWGMYRQVAAQAARKVARDYPGVDPDDIEQAIYVRALENVETYRRKDYGTAALFTVFVKYGTRYANDERISALHFSDQYHYTGREVRALCGEALFDREAFLTHLDNTAGTTAGADPEEVIARVVDLQDAYAALSERQRELIRSAFLGTEALNGSQRKEVTRIVDRLTVTINMRRSLRRANDPDHNGPGARTAISNTTAQTLTRKAYA